MAIKIPRAVFGNKGEVAPVNAGGVQRRAGVQSAIETSNALFEIGGELRRRQAASDVAEYNARVLADRKMAELRALEMGLAGQEYAKFMEQADRESRSRAIEEVGTLPESRRVISNSAKQQMAATALQDSAKGASLEITQSYAKYETLLEQNKAIATNTEFFDPYGNFNQSEFDMMMAQADLTSEVVAFQDEVSSQRIRQKTKSEIAYTFGKERAEGFITQFSESPELALANLIKMQEMVYDTNNYYTKNMTGTHIEALKRRVDELVAGLKGRGARLSSTAPGQLKTLVENAKKQAQEGADTTYVLEDAASLIEGIHRLAATEYPDAYKAGALDITKPMPTMAAGAAKLQSYREIIQDAVNVSTYIDAWNEAKSMPSIKDVEAESARLKAQLSQFERRNPDAPVSEGQSDPNAYLTELNRYKAYEDYIDKFNESARKGELSDFFFAQQTSILPPENLEPGDGIDVARRRVDWIIQSGVSKELQEYAAGRPVSPLPKDYVADLVDRVDTMTDSEYADAVGLYKSMLDAGEFGLASGAERQLMIVGGQKGSTLATTAWAQWYSGNDKVSMAVSKGKAKLRDPAMFSLAESRRMREVELSKAFAPFITDPKERVSLVDLGLSVWASMEDAAGDSPITEDQKKMVFSAIFGEGEFDEDSNNYLPTPADVMIESGRMNSAWDMIKGIQPDFLDGYVMPKPDVSMVLDSDFVGYESAEDLVSEAMATGELTPVIDTSKPGHVNFILKDVEYAADPALAKMLQIDGAGRGVLMMRNKNGNRVPYSVNLNGLYDRYARAHYDEFRKLIEE